MIEFWFTQGLKYLVDAPPTVSQGCRCDIQSYVYQYLDSMIYTRGSKGEWDQYAKISGNEGLSWDNILPFLKKVSVATSPSADLTFEWIGRKVCA